MSHLVSCSHAAVQHSDLTQSTLRRTASIGTSPARRKSRRGTDDLPLRRWCGTCRGRLGGGCSYSHQCLCPLCLRGSHGRFHIWRPGCNFLHLGQEYSVLFVIASTQV